MATSGQAPTIADMADALNNTESDIARALKYWQKCNLLQLHCNANGDIEFIELLPVPSEEDSPASTFNVIPQKNRTLQSVPQPAEITVLNDEKPLADVVLMPPAKPSYTPSTLSAAFRTKELEHLPYEAEVLLGKNLSAGDLSTIYYIHDQLGFSADLIYHLIEYCAAIGKRSFRYMEKVAISWHEQNIQTPEQAKAVCEQHSRINASVKRALGLATWGEEANNTVRQWTNQYHMEQDLIIEACNRAYKRTGGENALSYANATINNWHKAGISNLTELAKADEEYRAKHPKTDTAQKRTSSKRATGVAGNAFHNFEQGADIDYDALFSDVAKPLQPQGEK
jgi:DnaD/phage-associated family protein